MHTVRLIALATLIASHTAFPQAARVARSRSGDTTVIVTTGNGVWGPIHDAVEVKRINAESKETTFGSVYVVTATADGGVVVFDTKSLDGPIIRRFDADGRFVRNLGRRGSGPGEYELGPMAMNALSMTARPDGSVIVRESARAVMQYGPDGNYRNGFMLYHTNGSTNEIVAAVDGTFWVRAAFAQVRPPAPMPPGLRPMIHYDSAGKILDSLVQGPGWVAPGSDPSLAREWWAPIPDGRVMYTRADKVGFLLSDPRHSSAPMIVEATAQPVRYTPEERKEQEDLQDFTQSMPRPGPPPARRVIPETKQLAGGASVDINGRIWVNRPGPGQKVKPRVVASYSGVNGRGSFSASYQDQSIYVAFSADGTLLGELRFPAGVRPSFVGNTAWGIVRDEDDVPILVKYRIHD